MPVIVSDMPDEQAKRFRILDNKIAEKSSFDENELIEELKKLEAPKEMQAFFFEDIDMMINFSFDQFQQQAQAAGGFADFTPDTNYGGTDYSNDTIEQVPQEDYSGLDGGDGDGFESEEQPEDDGLQDIFRRLVRPDGTPYMKVICPYCGNVEEIELD